MSDSYSLSSRAVATSALALLLAGASFAPAHAGDHGKGHGKGDHGAKPARAQGATQDPPGNNGTFKVDGPAYDDGLGNEPHVTCEFRLKLYGFDEGQTGDITIAGQAPSGSGVVSSKTGVLLSDDAAGGGPNDVDAVVPYTAADLDLTGLTAHPKQGYHLKVTISTDTPGGVKHKVFWLAPCAPAPVVGGTTDTGSGTGEETGTEAGGTGTVIAPTGTSTEDRTERVSEVLGTKFVRGTAPTDTAVIGTETSRSGLPFTGSPAALLLALGGGLVAAGTGAVVAARRS
jgi:hypothetical protein